MIGSPRSIDDQEVSSMLFFDITTENTDQIPNGKLTPSMTGTAQQLTDNLKRDQDAGLTFPLLWPPFRGGPNKPLSIGEDLRKNFYPKSANEQGAEEAFKAQRRRRRLFF